MRLILCDAKCISADKDILVRKKLPKRYAAACRYVKEKNKNLSVASSFLLIREFPDINEDELFRSEHGKLFIVGEKQFNLSHSGSLAVMALDDAPVGVDVEQIDPKKINAALNVCTSDELEWIDGKDERFFQLWTIKEAVAKADGKGITSEMCKMSALPAISEGSVFYFGNKYFVRSIFHKDYCISIASKNEICEIETEEL